MAKLVCGEVMTKEVITCGPEMSARDAAELMGTRHIGSLPVVDGDGRLMGVVTDRDLVLRVMARDLDARGTAVSRVMSSDLVTASPDDDLDAVTDRMKERQVRRVYVVDGRGSLAGVIAQADVASRGGDRILTAQLVERVSQPGVPELVPGGMGGGLVE